jgi:hypothetical protein
MVGLKRELRIQDLSPYVESILSFRILTEFRGRKRNKAYLFLHMQGHNASQALCATTSHDPPIPIAARSAFTQAASTQSVSPGISPASQFTDTIPNEFMMSMNIPDASQPDPEPLIQIVRSILSLSKMKSKSNPSSHTFQISGIPPLLNNQTYPNLYSPSCSS